MSHYRVTEQNILEWGRFGSTFRPFRFKHFVRDVKFDNSSRQPNDLIVMGLCIITIFLHLPLREKCPYSEFFWAVFPRFRTGYGDILFIIRICPFGVQMRENTDPKNSECGHFSHSLVISCLTLVILKSSPLLT